MIKRIYKEESYQNDQFRPQSIKGFDKVVEKYGLADILFSALDYYKRENENFSANLTERLLQIVKSEVTKNNI